MRLLGILTVGIATAALAGCGGGERGGSVGERPAEILASAGAATQGAVAPEGITVVGVGSADTVPDVAGWSFGVRTRAETAEAALGENGAAMKGLLDALRAAGIAKDDLRTEQVSLYQQLREDEYGYGEEGPEILGYVASNTVRATVRAMDRAGAIVDAAVAAGANEVSGPELRIDDSQAQYEQAVEAAYDDARARAESVASKAGLSLGRPLAIVEGGGGGPVYDRMAVAEAADGAVIEPGRQSVTATLTVTFAIS